MVSYPTINLVDLVIDEVALEGLDGITIEALWLRLSQRLHNPLPFSKSFMSQIWSICTQVREFAFCELQIARSPLILFDRYEFVDPDLGTILEPEDIPSDIYPHCPIDDVANGIKGSCSTYNTRQDISEKVRNLNLDAVTQKYGQKLVIVASQSARNHALMGDEMCPTLMLNVIQYCFLERVGRSRYHGEVTQGKLSLSALKEDPKSLFYYRKFLLRHKLITKQIHHQKACGHSSNGSLLHLPRFFVERKPKVIFLAEEVIKILKSKPNYVAEYDEIKRKLRIEDAIKKLFKTSFFQKLVKTDIRVPYRTLYPNADPSEWRQKNNASKEKMIKVVQLLHPNIDILEAWGKDEMQEDDEPLDLNISNHKYGVPFLRQGNAVVETAGNEGVCQGSFSRTLGLTKLQARTILRNLLKAGIVATYMNDMGRQRVTKFVSKRFEKGSKMSKEFKQEINKMKELTKRITTENVDSEQDTTSSTQKDVPHVQEENVNNTIQSDEINKNNEIDSTVALEDKGTQSTTELQKVFHVVNRILYKYRLSKRANRYKCTFSNFQSSMTNQTRVSEYKKDSNKMSVQSSELSKNEKAAAALRNIKVILEVVTTINKQKSENEPFSFVEDVQNSEEKNTSNIKNITYRILRRANMIIESVKEHQVIDDMAKLMKMIHEEEDKEGYDVKIDKKSLLRLLQKLSRDNLIRIIKLTISGNGKEKHLTFICDTNINTNSAVIQSVVEQAKVKFLLMLCHKNRSPVKRSAEKLEYTKDKNADDVENKSENKTCKPFHSLGTKCGPQASRKYGYSPKFIRMQALHIFLFYLVYDHPGEPTISKEEQVQRLRNKDYNITDELASEFGKIYNTEVSWQMFVPPLPKYSGWPKGWTLMCDVLLRLPLSIFVKLHYVSFVVPEFEKYLYHPIRKHYLVKDLPGDIRNSLLYGRKYIFNIHETMTRLCYIGLIQFGPQRFKEKDQVFVYINRRTELLDTTSSAPNYHIIEDKSYPITKYNFDGTQAVEKYWYDMWNTCINTPLGGRLVVQGKDIVLEDLNKKQDMIKSIVARSPDEAITLDTGHVPGDRKGAAGIDSACFAHLKRNWNWGISTFSGQAKSQNNIVRQRDTYLSNIKAKPIKFTEFSGLKKVSGPPRVNATDLKRKAQNKKEENSNQQKKYEILTGIRNVKQRSYVRRVLPRKSTARKRVKYDEVDYGALQRMHKLRVDWDPQEDKMLLICKVAMVYLCPNPRKQAIAFTAVRDVLRTYLYSSQNKTSRACQRRLMYMVRQQQTVDNVTFGVEEIKQNFYIRKRYDGIVDRLKEEYTNSYECEKQIVEVFKSLVAYIAKKYYNISETGSKEPHPVPPTIQEFNLYYKVVHPVKLFSNRGFTKDVRNINDIHSAVINSVIHSSMCCGKDRRSWAYQLFKIYQQYPEMLLRNAMAKIRSDQMVTLKKNQFTAVRKCGNYMPMTSCQYQLSSNYMYKFHTKWPYNIFNESYDVFMKLSNWYCQNQLNNEGKVSDNVNGIEILPVSGGVIGAIHDYMMKDQIDFDVEIPDQVLVLDPRFKEKDETYFRIAERFQHILTSLDSLKYVKAFSSFNNDNMSSKVNDNKANADTKSDKDAFSDLEIEKTPQECGRDKRNVEGAKDFLEYDDLNVYSDEDNSCNVADDENNVIKFQDGTKIVLNKDDLQYSTLCDDGPMIDTGEVTVSNHENNSSLDIETQLQSTSKVIPNKFVEPKNQCTMVDQSNNSSKQEELPVISENKRFRDVCDERLDPEEPVQKRKKLNNGSSLENEGKNEILSLSNDGTVTELFDEVCGNASSSRLTNTTDENNDRQKNIDNAKTNTGDVVSDTGSTLPLATENSNNYTRVSDILKNIIPESSYLTLYSKNDDSSDMHKRYTRIALLRMREELNELTVTDSHHAHEYFVVNIFKVFYTLQTSNLQHSRENEIYRNLTLPSELIPLRLNIVNNLIQEISKSAIFPKDNKSYIDFKKNLPKNFSLNVNNIDEVYKFVRDKKELGASIQELIDRFENTLGEHLHRITSLLTEARLFLRTGVTHVRYVHHHSADAWLVHSIKINRLEREALLPVPKGTIYVTEPETAANKQNDTCITEDAIENPSQAVENESTVAVCEKSVESEIQSEVRSNKYESSDDDPANNNDDESNIQVKKRMQRKRTRLLPSKDISNAVKQLDLSTKQEIRVIIKPWIRIDGVLNRRVLDRMLGSVLSYCMTYPGVALTKIQNKFVPALQPYHTRELVEILIKLGCLEKIILKQPRVTLFSKSSHVQPKIINTDWESEENIFIEPKIGAMLKFGVFLSTKMYNSDFLT